MLLLTFAISCAPANELENGNCQFDAETGQCECIGSPVIIDLGGDGIELTTPQDGVRFELSPGNPRQWSWTKRGGNDAWLVFDRNQDGKINDGSEMFGDDTAQPVTSSPNGFAALAVYDKNHDGRIDPSDQIWTALRLWVDDGDGVTQDSELVALDAKGVHAISLDYKAVSTADGKGNEFRFATNVTADAPVTSQAYDVWLRSTKTTPNVIPYTTSYTCWAWGWYRTWYPGDDLRFGICDTIYVQGDPIGTDGNGSLARFVARYSTASTQQQAANRAQGLVTTAVQWDMLGRYPTCFTSAYQNPDLYYPPPYLSIYSNVNVRIKCFQNDTQPMDGGGGGTCE